MSTERLARIEHPSTQKLLSGLLATLAAFALAACGSSSSGTPAGSQPASTDIALRARSAEFTRQYEQRWHVSKDVADCVMAYENANQSDGAIAKGLAVDPRHVLGQIDCTKP